jgi:hypothetical protein
MNDRAADDAFPAYVFWLDEWFTQDNEAILQFTDRDQRAIFDRLTALD